MRHMGYIMARYSGPKNRSPFHSPQSKLAQGKLLLKKVYSEHFGFTQCKLMKSGPEGSRTPDLTQCELLWWTVGESNPRIRNANAVYYHCTNGPQLHYKQRRVKRD